MWQSHTHTENKILSSNFQWKFISMSALRLRLTDTSLHFSFRYGTRFSFRSVPFRSVLFPSRSGCFLSKRRHPKRFPFAARRKNQRGKRFCCRSVYIYYMVNIYLFWQTVGAVRMGGARRVLSTSSITTRALKIKFSQQSPPATAAATASTSFTIWEMSRRKHCEDAAAGGETKGGEGEGMGYDRDRQIGVVPTADYREINVNKWTTHVGAQKQQRGDGRARQKKKQKQKRKQMMMTMVMAMRLTTAMRGR